MSMSTIESPNPSRPRVEVEMARAFSGPRLVNVDYELEEREGEKYYPDLYLVYKARRKPVAINLGGDRVPWGQNDEVSLYRFTGRDRIYLLTINRGLEYVGIRAYDPDAENYENDAAWHVFLQVDWTIEELLGPRGINLPEQQIVRRIVAHHEGH